MRGRERGEVEITPSMNLLVHSLMEKIPDVLTKVLGDSVTPSTASLNRKLGTSPTPKMLKLSEIALLRRSKQEIAAKLKKSA
jgi:hypothetical protein